MNDRVGWGSLGKAKQQTSPRAPGYIGQLTLEQDVKAGTKLNLSAWVKSNDGGSYFSLVVQEPIQRSRPAPPPRRDDNFDEDIPF